jgi:hypothetical protein
MLANQARQGSLVGWLVPNPTCVTHLSTLQQTKWVVLQQTLNLAVTQLIMRVTDFILVQDIYLKKKKIGKR